MWDLLARFEAVLRFAGAPVVDNLAPGIAPDLVRERLAGIGMEPARELLTWFAWRNGIVDHWNVAGGASRLVRWMPWSLEEAIADWRQKDHGEEPWEWVVTWLPMATFEGMPRLVVDCSPPQDRVCTVRMVSPDEGLFSKPDRPSRSLAQAVQMWTDWVLNGWYVVVPPDDTQSGGWAVSRSLDIPLEDRLTGI